jgi:hypothetical protein
MLLPHDVDKHLVAASIYGHRIASAFEQIDLRTVPRDRREPIKQLREDVLRMLRDIEVARIGVDDHITRRQRWREIDASRQPSDQPSNCTP